MPWDTVRGRLSKQSAHINNTQYWLWGSVFNFIFFPCCTERRKKVFWFERSPRELLPEGCQSKVPWEKVFFGFFSSPTSKHPFKEYRPHRPKSYGSVWESRRVQRGPRGLPCGLSMATAGFMMEQKQTRRTVQSAKTWWSYSLSALSLLLFLPPHIFSPDLASFQPIPIFLSAF